MDCEIAKQNLIVIARLVLFQEGAVSIAVAVAVAMAVPAGSSPTMGPQGRKMRTSLGLLEGS